MPHRGPRASLRGVKSKSLPVAEVVPDTSSMQFRSMSAIQILKYGLKEHLWKKKGWLCNLLQREGMMDGTKQSRKEQCWQYYKSQMLYIEAMQEAKDDPKFDPRRQDHKTEKNGQFIKVKKGTVKPKNPLTVQYLCFAFNVPWSTFKRWKNEAFVDKVYIPAHKGNSVITDKIWTSQVFNARRMFIKHSMTVWLTKHPAMKNDKDAKKVIRHYQNIALLTRI
jgi:hypothetical protein